MLISGGPKPKDNIMNLPWVYNLINKRIDKMNQYPFWGKKMDSNKLLGNELVKFIKEYYKESNAQLIEKYGLESIKKYGY